MTTAASQGAGATRVRVRARRRSSSNLRPFLAIDGEAVENAYVVMTSSLGETVTNLAGLSTRECFNYLIRQASKPEKPIVVAFGLNYDVNMMLRDLDKETLIQLWETGECQWEEGEFSYAIEWIPSKLFSVYGESGDMSGSAYVYDVFGFFQTSFIKALTAWGFEDREFIAEMKEQRGQFSLIDLPTITRYSIEECQLLVELMDKLRDALHNVQLRPRSWLGAGAIASTVLGKHLIQEHRGEIPTPALNETILRAYFGGRTEVFRQGIFPFAESLDINSAYPAATLELPSGVGDWKRRREYDPEAEFAIWRVSWKIPEDSILAPFPFRNKRAITFPLEGEGYYHACEIRSAIALYGDSIRVSSGYVFYPADDRIRPFTFLADVYNDRQKLKAENHPSEKVLKLGINSVYGKLAQGNSRDGRRPRFQSYFWAGYITARTRARVLQIASILPENLVAIATDGIVFAPTSPRIQFGKGLGAWERTRYRDFFVAQPGMYHGIERATNTHVKHSRGFFTKELDFPKLRRLWLERGPIATLPCPSHRFVGLGSALYRKDFSVWRTWEDGERRVSLYLSPRKRYLDLEPEQHKQLLPPERVRAGISDVYVPKRAVVELDPETEEWIQGVEQPLRSF